MKNRRKMNSSKSKKLFSKTASRGHKFNIQGKPKYMRGGIRM